MTPSWDLFLTIFFSVGIAYGMILQREKAIVTLIAIYMALVLTDILFEPISQFFVGEKTLLGSFFIRSSASPFTIQAITFVVLIVLVTTKSGLSGGSDGAGLLSPIEIFVYSFLNVALITTTILAYIPDESRNNIIQASSIASFLISHGSWWLILPVLAMVFFGWNRYPFLKT